MFPGRTAPRAPGISERSSALSLTALIFMENTTNGYLTMEVCMALPVDLNPSLYLHGIHFNKRFTVQFVFLISLSKSTNAYGNSEFGSLLVL